MYFTINDLSLSMSLIHGASIGAEFIPAEEEFENGFIVDLILIRLLFEWP